MSKTLPALLTFILISLLSVPISLAQGPRLSDKTPASPAQLFNGRNLDGWYTFLKDRGRDNDPKRVFTVSDGKIRISGEEWGCITTEQTYDNYRLVVEFKWGDQTFDPRKDKARDSGVLLHSNGKDGGRSGIWMHSIECQMIEGGTGDFIVVGDRTENFSVTAKVAPEMAKGAHVYYPDGLPVIKNGGRVNWYGRDPNWVDELGFRGKKDVENPIGEWNTLECIAVGDKISVLLNGILVNESYNVRPTTGRIQIQSEGAELFIRKVELSPLSEKQIISIHAENGRGIGPKIKLMPEWRAFGFFTSHDQIKWEEVFVPGNNTYDVYLEWSVSDKDAGKPYVLEIGKAKLKGTVERSGSWEEFRTIKIGTLKLKKGTYKASFKPKEKSFRGGLLDFREIKLIPR